MVVICSLPVFERVTIQLDDDISVGDDDNPLVTPSTVLRPRSSSPDVRDLCRFSCQLLREVLDCSQTTSRMKSLGPFLTNRRACGDVGGLGKGMVIEVGSAMGNEFESDLHGADSSSST